MFLAVFIEDGIGVGDVDQNFAALRVFGKLREQAVASRKGKMAHFAGSFLAAANFDEFIVRPESTVQKRNVAGSRSFHAFCRALCQKGGVAKKLSRLFEARREDCP